MPQQDLDHPNIGVLLQKMRRKAVTKGMRRLSIGVGSRRRSAS
jgi:hypothetical protein